MNPSFDEFRGMAHAGNLIPVYEEYPIHNETPVTCYEKIKEKAFSYVLESAQAENGWGRYSIIGWDPFVVAHLRDHQIAISRGEEREVLEARDPLHALRALMKGFKFVPSGDLPRFQGGLVGYFNYDVIRHWERLPGIVPESQDLPEAIFTASKRLLIFDHLRMSFKVVVLTHLPQGCNLAAVYQEACGEIEETAHEINRSLREPSSQERFSLSPLVSNYEKEAFEAAVEKAKDHIIAGDVIQVVLSQRFSGKISGPAFPLYKNLRTVNPSPYMFYLHFGDTKLIGTSPEILVRVTDGKIVLRPIAGTRPRGKTPEEDQALEQDLLSDPKERAEHIMLVDLGRNDVGRVAAPGSVRVERLMEVDRFSHVMHIVSNVEGRLRAGKDIFDVFMACFPAGTVTGAPKIRAMEIISELEPSSRGPYAGAVGYFGFNGNMDFCITIRTIAIEKTRVSVQAGAGIVYDSEPSKEYEETLNKAAAMFKAIEGVSRHDPDH
ncbi:MAG: anthranilate synthase component I [Desulfobacterales bacterium]|nr:anthranilate synthase component I [Desulfobacterales bacterium]